MTTKSTHGVTGHLFLRSLPQMTHSLASFGRSAALICSLAHSLASGLMGKIFFVYESNASVLYYLQPQCNVTSYSVPFWAIQSIGPSVGPSVDPSVNLSVGPSVGWCIGPSVRPQIRYSFELVVVSPLSGGVLEHLLSLLLFSSFGQPYEQPLSLMP